MRSVVLLALVACGHDPPPPSMPSPAAVPIAPVASSSTPIAIEPPPPPLALPSALAAASSFVGASYDADAGAFVRPRGVTVLVHAPEGDTQTMPLPKAASCAKEDAWARLAPDLRVLRSDGAKSVVDCVIAILSKDAAWKKNLAATDLEIVVTKSR